MLSSIVFYIVLIHRSILFSLKPSRSQTSVPSLCNCAFPFTLQTDPSCVCVSQVSDFTWSHDGTQALISYRDGFVLVGSVSGQRHWSSEINLESQITCGIWTPDDQQVRPLEYGCVMLKPRELRRKRVNYCHTGKTGWGRKLASKPLKEAQRKRTMTIPR